MLNPTSPVTGQAIVGLTSPGFTILPGNAPNNSAKQWYVSGLTGTQTGVVAHSVSLPYTITAFTPPVAKALPAGGSTDSVIRNVPKNTYRVLVRKGSLPAANQPAQINSVELIVRSAAGTETFSKTDQLSMLSLAVGFITQQIDELSDTISVGS